MDSTRNFLRRLCPIECTPRLGTARVYLSNPNLRHSLVGTSEVRTAQCFTVAPGGGGPEYDAAWEMAREKIAPAPT